jgi:phage terminase large subunit-like protein
MLSAPPLDTPDPSEFRNWKPEAQERALELLQRRQARPWKPFYCRKARCNGQPHVRPADKRPCPNTYGHQWEHDGRWQCIHCQVTGTAVDEWTWNHARWDQHPPKWHADWYTWLLSGGRGSGKTRSGSEVTHRATELYERLIFVAPTGPDFRATMVEGVSGLQRTAKPGHMPEYEPSKKQLTWPNGCIGLGFSAEEPDRLRGPESGFIWADEPAHYPNTDLVWSNMKFGHRMIGVKGAQPKIVATSTPKPTKWMKETLADGSTVVHRVSSYANLANLAESYKRNVLAPHQGTRLGRQEIEGELLEDVEGALWNWDMFRWLPTHPPLKRAVVAIDPAGTANERSDETGIIVIGIDFEDRLYVLDDQSGKYSPGGWADRAMAAFDWWKADAIVPEKTYGRDMVTNTLENSRLARKVLPKIDPVDSRRGKQIRAEPIVAVYEKNRKIEDSGDITQLPLRIAHVGERGRLAQLEDELTSWVPSDKSPSPNRLDALVHGATYLLKGAAPMEFASPVDLGPTYTGPPSGPTTSTPSGIEVPNPIYGGFSVWTP